MEGQGTKRVELYLPVRTVLIIAAAIGGDGLAFAAIGDTFLIVFIGVFLALVFEFPVRFVMEKTGMSGGARGNGHRARHGGCRHGHGAAFPRPLSQ